MTDKELLELAAKAAGIDGSVRPDGIKIGSGNYWNPLTDDGDALRLAVKLDIDLYWANDDGLEAYAGYNLAGKQRRMYAVVPVKDDTYAATRRAIVRAAAEIGRTK